MARDGPLLSAATRVKLQPLGKRKLTPKAGSLKSICEPETVVTDCASEGSAAARKITQIEARRIEGPVTPPLCSRDGDCKQMAAHEEKRTAPHARSRWREMQVG